MLVSIECNLYVLIAVLSGRDDSLEIVKLKVSPIPGIKNLQSPDIQSSSSLPTKSALELSI